MAPVKLCLFSFSLYFLFLTANSEEFASINSFHASRNNYEILKLLLDRGATIPIPHDVKCSCDECITGIADDSLKFSLARINAYRLVQGHHHFLKLVIFKCETNQTHK